MVAGWPLIRLADSTFYLMRLSRLHPITNSTNQSNTAYSSVLQPIRMNTCHR